MTDLLIHSRWAAPAWGAAGLFWTAVLLLLARTGLPGRGSGQVNVVQRVVANGSVPLVSQLANRVVDLGFAAVMLRLLGATGNGEYAIAVVTWLYVKTVTDFGLGVLATREIARYPERAGKLVGSTVILRLLVLTAVTPLVTLYALSGLVWLDLTRTSVFAIALLVLAIIPGSYTEAINAAFNGFERMTFPAILNVATNLARAGFGLAALALGGGVVGLALVALGTTTVSALAYHLALRQLPFKPEWSRSRPELRALISDAWPLLLNGLLINLFFRVDVFIIQSSQGDHALGIYDAAYKYINMLLLVPAYFTLAVFPLLARHALQGRDQIAASYRLATKLMLILALGILVTSEAIAPLLIRLLAGEAFLPDSATALRVLVLFLPWSYVNGVTQYVLIALDRQRTITHAFALAVGFNLLANLALIPSFGYLAAAATTAATEVVLFVALLRTVRATLPQAGLLGVVGRPIAAAALTGAVVALTYPLGGLISAALGLTVYLAALVLLRAVGQQEFRLARALVSRSRPAVTQPL